MHSKLYLVLSAALITLQPYSVWSDCAPGIKSNLQKVVLDDNNVVEPMELDVAPDGRVFFIERAGKVKVYNPLTFTTTVIAQLNVTL